MVFDEHVFQRGWPVELGGALPDADFDMSLTADMKNVMKTSVVA